MITDALDLLFDVVANVTLPLLFFGLLFTGLGVLWRWGKRKIDGPYAGAAGVRLRALNAQSRIAVIELRGDDGTLWDSTTVATPFAPAVRLQVPARIDGEGWTVETFVDGVRTAATARGESAHGGDTVEVEMTTTLNWEER
jgi:hypothetical protein